MTFTELRNRLQTRWWWILISIFTVNLLCLGWIQSESYSTLFSAKISLDPKFYSLKYQTEQIPNRVILDSDGMATGYSTNNLLVSKYFQEYFGSSDAQKRIYTLENLTEVRIPEKPDYTISLLGNAVVEIRHEFQSRQDAEEFNSSVKAIYLEEVKNWNETKPDMLQLLNGANTTEVFIARKPLQMQALPTLAGLLLGLAVAVSLPTQTKARSITTLTESSTSRS